MWDSRGTSNGLDSVEGDSFDTFVAKEESMGFLTYLLFDRDQLLVIKYGFYADGGI